MRADVDKYHEDLQFVSKIDLHREHLPYQGRAGSNVRSTPDLHSCGSVMPKNQKPCRSAIVINHIRIDNINT